MSVRIECESLVCVRLRVREIFSDHLQVIWALADGEARAADLWCSANSGHYRVYVFIRNYMNNLSSYVS